MVNGLVEESGDRDSFIGAEIEQGPISIWSIALVRWDMGAPEDTEKAFTIIAQAYSTLEGARSKVKPDEDGTAFLTGANLNAIRAYHSKQFEKPNPKGPNQISATMPFSLSAARTGGKLTKMGTDSKGADGLYDDGLTIGTVKSGWVNEQGMDDSHVSVMVWHKNLSDPNDKDAKRKDKALGWTAALKCITPCWESLNKHASDVVTWELTPSARVLLEEELLHNLNEACESQQQKDYKKINATTTNSLMGAMDEGAKRAKKIDRNQEDSKGLKEKSAKFTSHAKEYQYKVECAALQMKLLCLCLPIVFCLFIGSWLYKTLTLKDIRG